MKLGKLVRKLREAKGLSQVKLGAMVGITQPSISEIEGGGSSPDLLKPGTYKGLAVALEVSIQELYGAAIVSDEEPQQADLIEIYNKLSNGDRKRWIDIGRVLLAYANGIVDVARVTAEEPLASADQKAGAEVGEDISARRHDLEKSVGKELVARKIADLRSAAEQLNVPRSGKKGGSKSPG